MKFNITDKWVLLMRHAAFLWGAGGRIRLAKTALNIIGRHRLPRVWTAPEKEAETKTAEPVIDYLATECALGEPGAFPELAVCQALAERSNESLDDLAVQFKTRQEPEFVITHFARLEHCLTAMRKVNGLKLKVPNEKIRHKNKAYLINLSTDQVFVIKEKS